MNQTQFNLAEEKKSAETKEICRASALTSVPSN